EVTSPIWSGNALGSCRRSWWRWPGRGRSGAPYCEHLGQVHRIGESWMTSDCLQCVCMEPFGVGCCDLVSKPVDYPEWCEIIRKPDSCVSVAVMRVNHKLPCLWGQGRLKTAGQPWIPDNNPLF
uniref:Si:ch1073-70f20.1 n=1 Tax=Nothobranchius furzeri TaxID=105023 RepID=A0A8C6LNT0_NOTFU